ncbi:MAG: fructose bisphosphate aldolase [Clostridia bacterium]|nr:fructose bisphosphate aldolase [Clostridia bacterium]
MDEKKLEAVKFRDGFIAALDQSGGSTAKTLAKYGIPESSYSSEDEMFDLIHEMRKRVFTSKEFTSEKILGAILFYKTMMSKVDDEYTADYLWNKKHIVSFLKVDKGLRDEENGCKLMKDIPDLDDQLKEARAKNVFGTKMRSVIYKADEKGIEDIVNQQFEFAKVICDAGLVPIIEPEVDINAEDKALCEDILKAKIEERLNSWDQNDLIMFKFTIPTIANKYLSLYDYPCVVRIVALSGGYTVQVACDYLAQNDKMIASFSRALLEDLNVNLSDEEYDEALKSAIDMIYQASV